MSYIYDDFTGSSGLSAVKWDRNTVADGKWLQKYTLEPIRSADVYLASAVDYEHMRIDMLENATDVITIYESYSSFTATSGDLFNGSDPGLYITDYDIVKVLNDETESGCQTYWQWVYTAGPAPAEPDPTKGEWQAKGALQPYYTTAQIDEMISELSSSISGNYLSASDNSVSGGKNISIDYTATPAKIVINTTDDAEFGKLSATDYVSAAEAYAVSISGNNISGDTKTSTIDDLITSAADGEAASAWIDTYGADLFLSANAGSAASAWISTYSPNLIISANAGSAASAWISNNKSNIETASGYAKNWNDNKNALYQSAYSGYAASAWIANNKTNLLLSANAGSAASAWIAGYEIIAKYNNTTKSFTGNKLTLSAGDGVGFTTANNQITISAEGRRYSGGRCIEIDIYNKLNLSSTISAQSGYLNSGYYVETSNARTATVSTNSSAVYYISHGATQQGDTRASASWYYILTNNETRNGTMAKMSSGDYISSNGSITAIITANSIPSNAASNVVYMI